MKREPVTLARQALENAISMKRVVDTVEAASVRAMSRRVPAIERLITSAGPYRRGLVFVAHVVLLCAANYLAFFLRFEGEIPERAFALFSRVLPLLLIVRIAAFVPFRLFDGLWRYVSIRDLRNIVAAVTCSSVVFVLLVRYVFGVTDYPRSVFVIDWLLLISFLSGVRCVKRVVHGASRGQPAERKVLIVGAGDGAEMLLCDIDRQPWHGYQPIGCVDDDPEKKGRRIRGVPVLGGRRDLGSIVAEHSPAELLVAMPSASKAELNEVVADCRQHGLPVKTLPDLREILRSGGVLDSIQNLGPEDLLARAPVSFASEELSDAYHGQSVMVTGAGGSIGSELARQLAKHSPSCLVLFERHEGSLFHLENTLCRSFPDLTVVPIIGDVLDAVRVRQVLVKYEPSVIFHAAAYKHVPMMERNPREAIKVNVLGTQNLARVAVEQGVERFVFISTDKAVNPINVMGKTKRLAELMLQRQNHESGSTRFITVRFGNVLESSGSVVPFFKEQILRGGPVTVTHSEATRYFMTTGEAVYLVLSAALLGNGGEIFVLDMGEPIRVLDLAKRLIRLYGYEPEQDIEIQMIGLRPGERLHERLFNPNEEVRKTRHPRIRMAVGAPGSRLTQILGQIPILERDAFNGVGVTDLDARLTAAIENACAKN